MCVTAAGMKSWADCNLGCEVIDNIFGALAKFSNEKLLVCGSSGVAGLGGMVTCSGVLVLLIAVVGVHCPQGSELPWEDPMICWSFWLLSVFWGVVGATGLNVDDGVGINPEVEGIGVLSKGYIPSCRSCHSMRSTSCVTLSMIVTVLYNSGKSLISS